MRVIVDAGDFIQDGSCKIDPELDQSVHKIHLQIYYTRTNVRLKGVWGRKHFWESLGG